MTLLLASVLLVPAGAQTASEEEPGWTNLNPDPRPMAVSGPALTYDSRADRVILYGGRGPSDQTWSYDFDSNAWVNLRSTEAPPARSQHALAYDVQSDRVILYGGDLGTRAGEGRADTWAFDSNTNTWTNMTPSLSPPPRAAHALAYDSDSDRVILFGGRTPPFNFPQNDTWAYDTNTNTWTDMNPVVRPPARCCHAMAYDAESDRVILFGGITEGLMRRDTWSYDFDANTWTEMSPDPRPGERRYHAMTYDSQADRVFVFGGTATAGGQVFWTNETWAYDRNRNQWTNVTPATSPSIRTLSALAYDAESNRVILFGGDTPNRPSDETWAFLYVPPAPGFIDPLFVGLLAALVSGLVAGSAIVVLWRRRRREEGPRGAETE